MFATDVPFPFFADLDGSPLDGGRVYYGSTGQNPETNPITVYWDSAQTQPAAQPIMVLNGFAVRNGTPALVFATGDYSSTVRNRRGELVCSALSSTEASNAATLLALITELRADLADDTDADNGAGMVAYDPALPYEAPSIGATIGHTIDAAYYGVGSNPATDYTAALIEALSQGASQGKEVILPPWTTRIDGQLPMVSNLALIGRNGKAILDFSNTALASTDALMVGAGSLGSAALLTVAANKWTNQITAPGNGLVVGDWFRAISTVDANSSAAGEDQLGERTDVVYLTETHQVFAKPSSDVIEVRGMLRFSYPIGSAVKKITPLSNILLRDLTIEQGSVANRLVEATLVDCMRISGMDVRDPGGEVIYRGCFNGSRIDHLRSHAAPDTALATNRQVIKITDGSTGVIVADMDLANGGQMIDITYTPTLSSTISAPTLDTMIQRGHIRNTSFSAITDHPTCDGTVVADVTMQQVRSAVFIRSRNATVKNVEAWGESGAANGNGVWLGEDGYWNQARVEGCKMHGFDIGYLMTGAGANIERRDANLSNNLSTYCRVGERWGSVNTPDGSGCISSKNTHLFPTESGVEIGGNWVGLRIHDATVRGGAPTAGAFNFTASADQVEITGQVIDISGEAGIAVTAGTPTNVLVDLRRFGDVSQNVGLTAAMVRAKPRMSARRTVFLNNPLTGTTAETNLLASWITIAAGEFNGCTRIEARIRGTKTGTAGTAAFRISTPGGDLYSTTAFITAAGPFDITMVIEGTGDATQSTFATVLAEATAPDMTGPTLRTNNPAAGLTLNLSCQLANAADTVQVYTADAEITTS